MIKIIATVGPQTANVEDILTLNQFTKVFRLNGSHSTLEWHKQAISLIRDNCEDAFILLDIPGIKPRSSNTKSLSIQKGQKVQFGGIADNEDITHVGLTKELPFLNSDIPEFSVDDGQFTFEVSQILDNAVIGTSLDDFVLHPKKGINIKNSVFDEEKQFEIYQKFIEDIQKLELDIDALGLSFVQTEELVQKVKKIAPSLLVISKVENTMGLANCAEIVAKSDATMIDRGDLAAEIGVENLYAAVEKISLASKSAGKPLIMATENLQSMSNKNVPTKGEVMALSHSISIGADAIMLSEETATYENWLSVMKWLNSYLSNANSSYQIPKTEQANKFPEVWQLVKELKDTPCLLVTISGYALHNYIACHPEGKLHILTNNPKIEKLVKIMAQDINVIKKAAIENMPIEMIWETIQSDKNTFFKENDRIVAIYVSKYVNHSRANSITFFSKDDF